MGMKRGIGIALCCFPRHTRTHSHTRWDMNIFLPKAFYDILISQRGYSGDGEAGSKCGVVVVGGARGGWSSLLPLPVWSHWLWVWSKGARLICAKEEKKKTQNGGEADQRACAVIFCECSLSTIPPSLSKSPSVPLCLPTGRRDGWVGGGSSTPLLPPITPTANSLL